MKKTLDTSSQVWYFKTAMIEKVSHKIKVGYRSGQNPSNPFLSSQLAYNRFSTISQVDTQPCAVQRKPVNRCLIAFYRKQKNVLQQKVLATGAPTSSDLSGCTSNVAGSHQSGRVSHFRYLWLVGLELMHGENHNKQSLWNYEYPAPTGLRDFALSCCSN